MANIMRVGGGGGDLGLNVFCQPNFPLTYNGVLLKTPAKETVKKGCL